MPLQAVLTCARPPSPPPQPELLTFKPPAALGALERPGLNPVRKVRVTRKLMKTRPTALDSHKRFMHQLTRGARQRKAAKAAAAAGQQQAQQSLKDFTARLRSDILSGDVDVSTTWKPAARAAALQQHQQQVTSAAPAEAPGTTLREEAAAEQRAAAEQLQAEMERWVTQVLQEAATSTADRAATSASGIGPAEQQPASGSGEAEGSGGQRPGTSCSVRSASKGKAKAKPAWALTEGEADEVAELEEDELLGFAAELDFEAFADLLGDDELAEAFQALQVAEQHRKEGQPNADKQWRRSFVRLMNSSAMAHISQHAAGSQAGSEAGRGPESCSDALTEGAAARRAALLARLGAGGSDKGWDASTRVGDTDKQAAKAAGAVTKAEEVLADLPQLKAVHSPASARAILSSAAAAVEAAAAAAADHQPTASGGAARGGSS